MSDSDNDAQFPLRAFLGMGLGEDDEVGSGTATVAVGPDHLNPNGVVHGGVLFTMADTSMGKATMSVLDEGQFCASVEVQLRFIRPVAGGTITSTATVTKHGRSIIHLEARITGDDGRLVATATGTFTVISFEPVVS